MSSLKLKGKFSFSWQKKLENSSCFHYARSVANLVLKSVDQKSNVSPSQSSSNKNPSALFHRVPFSREKKRHEIFAFSREKERNCFCQKKMLTVRKMN